MADKDHDNEEYTFAEPDSHDEESMGETPDSSMSTRPGFSEKKNVIRNALVAASILVLAVLAYEFVPKIFHKSKPVEPVKPEPAPVSQVMPQPVEIKPEPVAPKEDTELKQKVTTIETNLQSATSQVSSLSEQVTTVNNSVKSLNEQITKLNQTITDLSNQVAKQSEEIRIIMVRSKPKRVKIKLTQVEAPLVYYIKAVIPGRAWPYS